MLKALDNASSMLWRQQTVTVDWQTAVVPIFKKGDWGVSANHQRSTLLHVAYGRVLERTLWLIVKTRLEQCGFFIACAV